MLSNSLCYHLGSPRKDRQLASDRNNTWKTACCISRKLHWGIASWQVRTSNIFRGQGGRNILCWPEGAYKELLAVLLWAEERKESVFSIALADLIFVMIFSFLPRHLENLIYKILVKFFKIHSLKTQWSYTELTKLRSCKSWNLASSLLTLVCTLSLLFLWNCVRFRKYIRRCSGICSNMILSDNILSIFLSPRMYLLLLICTAQT